MLEVSLNYNAQKDFFLHLITLQNTHIMKKTFYYILLLLSLLGLGGCNDDDNNTPTNPVDLLPPATQTGANTFGYLINGEPLSITNSYHMTAIYQGGGVQFGGGGVYMVVLDPFTVNIPYVFMGIGEGTARAKYTKQIEEGITCFYEYGHTYEGFVKFSKIDTNNYIISGTFEFSTVNEQCDTVRITNGRFDMRYTP